MLFVVSCSMFELNQGKEKYVISVGCSMFELNQGKEKCVFFNFGCITCWVMIGDI